jgi:ion channel-forming bestrophin family protein
MVDYNPKTWWKLIFMFHKSDTFRVLIPAMLGIAVYTALVAYIENDVLHAQFKNTTVVHSLVGFVLSMLLVFRTNTAYDRWWEGRKIWGSFTNNSRNLALKLNAILDNSNDKKIFRILISNYIFASKEHLRKRVKMEELEECEVLSYQDLKDAKHIPNRIMKAIYLKINELNQKKVINNEQLLYINPELLSFTDNIGACERIRNTPIPYSYSLFLKKAIFLYILTMPIGFVMDFKYWSIPIVSLVFYAFAGIEVIAEEIEDPFGHDANDLPTDQISVNIKKNLIEILEES